MKAQGRCVAVLAVLVVLTTGPAGLAGQAVVVSEGGCARCQIVVSKVATLGGAGDPVSASQIEAAVTRDSRRNYLLSPTADLAVMAVYDSTGRFLRTLGRSGAGPGEYAYISRAEFIQGDSLLVLDVGQTRITWLAPDGTPARTMRMAGRFNRAAPLPNGDLLVQGRVRSPNGVGYPLHVIAPNGEVRRSFGSTTPEARGDRPQADFRQMSEVRGDAVWTARVDRYELERWGIDGQRREVIQRQVDWYPAWDYSDGLHVMSRPFTMSVWEDPDGLLWSIVRRPTSTGTLARMQRGVERALPPHSEVDGNHDVVIEVFDPKSMQLLASVTRSEYFIGHVRDDLVYSMRETSEGDLRIDVWQIRLVRGQ